MPHATDSTPSPAPATQGAHPGVPAAPTVSPQATTPVPPVVVRDHRTEQQLADMQAQLAKLQQAAESQRKPEALTPEQYAALGLDESHLELGTQILDANRHIAKRAAKEEMQALRAQFEQALEAQREQFFWTALSAAVPDWEAINQSPAFLSYLAATGQQPLLAAAREAYDAVAVIRIFTSFRNSGQHQASSAPPPGPIASPQPDQFHLPGGAAANVMPRPVPGPVQSGPVTYSFAEVNSFMDAYAKGVRPPGSAERMTEYQRAIVEGRVR